MSQYTSPPENNLLTVTILEAQLKNDTSNFLNSMSVYCLVRVNGDSRQSESRKGANVKFKNASFGFRTSSLEHFIDLQIYQQSLILADEMVGQSVLKV